MSKYKVGIPLVAYVYVEVDATDEDTALEKAFDEACVPNLCSCCSKLVTIDDLDSDNLSTNQVEELESDDEEEEQEEGED